MNLIIENGYLNQILKQIQNNLNKFLGHIESYNK